MFNLCSIRVFICMRVGSGSQVRYTRGLSLPQKEALSKTKAAVKKFNNGLEN